MRRMMRNEACVTDLVLDEWMADDLDRETSERVASHVASCADCNARHATYRGIHQAFLQRSPSYAQHGTRFSPRSTQIRRPRLRAFTIAGSVLAVAAAVLLARIDADPLGVRSKGAAHLDFFVKRGQDVRAGVRGETLAPGDALRFTYTSQGKTHLALFNLDTHKASVYFPSGTQAAAVRGGEQVALDFSVELDAELGLERIYGLFCRESFALEPLRAALAANRDMRAPPDCQLDVITIHKAPRP